MLGLGMVPVTIRREIDGQDGTLQLVPAGAVSEAELVGIKHEIAAPCSFAKQAATMRIFDALISNPARTPSTMLYQPNDILLILVNHAESFGARAAWPGHSPYAGLTIGAEWKAALSRLDDATLRTELGDVLSEQQLAGLGQRRDALLTNSAASVSP